MQRKRKRNAHVAERKKRNTEREKRNAENDDKRNVNVAENDDKRNALVVENDDDKRNVNVVEKDRQGGVNWTSLKEKTNDLFEKYYRAQQFLQDGKEFEQMMKVYRTPLPTAFRINPINMELATEIRNTIEQKYSVEIRSANIQVYEDPDKLLKQLRDFKDSNLTETNNNNTSQHQQGEKSAFQDAKSVQGEPLQDAMCTVEQPPQDVMRTIEQPQDAMCTVEQPQDVMIPPIKPPPQDAMRTIEPPQQMPWYPNGLGWTIDVPRNVLRKHPVLNQFRTYLMAQTEEGHVSRQEAVSMLPPLMFQPIEPHDRILDMCAAPGSKTAQLLEMLVSSTSQQEQQEQRLEQMEHKQPVEQMVPMEHKPEQQQQQQQQQQVAQQQQQQQVAPLSQQQQQHITVPPAPAQQQQSPAAQSPSGFVVANDMDTQRCFLLTHQLQRLGTAFHYGLVTNHNAIQYPAFGQPFTKILCDVMCSSDGTLRKSPDLWNRWKPSAAFSLHKQQIRVAYRAFQLLEVGGTMVYSTCSLNPVEDEAVIAELLRRSKNCLQLVDCSNLFPGLNYSPGVSSWVLMNERGETLHSPAEDARLTAAMFPPTSGEPEIANQLHYTMRIMPHQNNTGGFFLAKLKKICSLSSIVVAPPDSHDASREQGKQVFQQPDNEQLVFQNYNEQPAQQNYNEQPVPQNYNEQRNNSGDDQIEDGNADVALQNQQDEMEQWDDGQDTERVATSKKPRTATGRADALAVDEEVCVSLPDQVWNSIREFYELDESMCGHDQFFYRYNSSGSKQKKQERNKGGASRNKNNNNQRPTLPLKLYHVSKGVAQVMHQSHSIRSEQPTVENTKQPTTQPTVESTAQPIVQPIVQPTVESTAQPTVESTAQPTMESTGQPPVESTGQQAQTPQCVQGPPPSPTIQLISVGTRVMETLNIQSQRVDRQHIKCMYRITQEGANVLYRHMGPARILKMNMADFKIFALNTLTPFYLFTSPTLKQQLHQMDYGGCLIVLQQDFQPANSEPIVLAAIRTEKSLVRHIPKEVEQVVTQRLQLFEKRRKAQ